MDVYLETGAKRVFAGALEWPGWSRSGRDEASALQALLDYAPRYARVVSRARLGFRPPAGVEVFNVVERLAGDATTDFGVPGAIPRADALPVNDAGVRRLAALLRACWRAFDAAMDAAAGKALRRGPRGGGRDLDGIAGHVWGAEAGYLAGLGWKFKPADGVETAEALRQTRAVVLSGLAAAAHGEIPPRGPRGGVRWPPRYFVRRAAWHVLDHAWEIEDRAM